MEMLGKVCVVKAELPETVVIAFPAAALSRFGKVCVVKAKPLRQWHRFPHQPSKRVRQTGQADVFGKVRVVKAEPPETVVIAFPVAALSEYV